MFRRIALGSLLFLSVFGVCGQSHSSPARPKAPIDRSAATRYAAMSARQCYGELRRRRVPFATVGATPGVLAPLRLRGPLNGVIYKTELSESERRTTPFEIMDCRFVLSLHDFSTILKRHGVDQASFWSVYRPMAGSRLETSVRHPAALAMDIWKLRANGRWLIVQSEFHGKIDATTCGDGAEAAEPDTDAARELRAIACEAGAAKIFHSILTPNHDEPHNDHFHLDIHTGTPYYGVD